MKQHENRFRGRAVGRASACAFLYGVIILGAGSGEAQSDGVCAKVGLRLDQSAVMTRTAFRATLEISNHDPASPLQSIGAQVEIKDATGEIANSRFQIEAPTLDQIDRVDGHGTLQPSTTATIRWLLIPSDEAAPTTNTEFYVGGQFSYTLGGLQAHVPLEPIKTTSWRPLLL